MCWELTELDGILYNQLDDALADAWDNDDPAYRLHYLTPKLDDKVSGQDPPFWE